MVADISTCSECFDVTTRAADRKPTDSELIILNVMWERGSATVREVFDKLGPEQGMGYTTVLKLMQIMTDKGILIRDETVRPQVFRAARSQRQSQRHMLRDLIDRAFGGSPGNLVLHALSLRNATPEEMRQIRELLDEQEGGRA